MAHDVFISFKTEDKIIAEKIYEGLQTRGIACWIFSKSIPFGTNFQSEIVRAIRECKIVLLIFSSAAQNSTEIPRELALASEYKKLIIPVRIEEIEPNDTFKYAIATSQYLDVCHEIEHRLDEYINQIYQAVSYHLPTAAQATPPQATTLKTSVAKPATKKTIRVEVNIPTFKTRAIPSLIRKRVVFVLVCLGFASGGLSAAFFYFKKVKVLQNEITSIKQDTIKTVETTMVTTAPNSAVIQKINVKKDLNLPPSKDLKKYPIEQAQPMFADMLRGIQNGQDTLVTQAVQTIRQLPKPAEGNRAQARAANTRGLELLKQKEFSASANQFLLAVQTDPTDEEALNNLAYAYHMAGATTQSLQWSKAALTISPTRSTAWFNAAAAFADTGKRDESIAAYLLAYQYSRSPSKTDDLVRAVSEQSDISSAAKATGAQALTILASKLKKPYAEQLKKP